MVPVNLSQTLGGMRRAESRGSNLSRESSIEIHIRGSPSVVQRLLVVQKSKLGGGIAVLWNLPMDEKLKRSSVYKGHPCQFQISFDLRPI